MQKTLLLKEIVNVLQALNQSAADAAKDAHHVATHEENIAENKYDTMGLEASYLAHGQQKRQAECEADLNTFKALTPIQFTEAMPIAVGALIELQNPQTDHHQWLFLSPVAGGLKVEHESKEITLITPSSPLGNALLNCYAGEDVSLTIAGNNEDFEIMSVY